MKHLVLFEAFTNILSLKNYGITPEEFRKEVDRVNRERNLEIERHNRMVDIINPIISKIRHDKLSLKDIDILLKKAIELKDTDYVKFLRKMPRPDRKRIKDSVTKQGIMEYLNLNIEQFN
jgi:hypothetical protein